jgi:hypothetical protein
MGRQDVSEGVFGVDVAILSQKLMIGAKGGRNFKVCLKEFQSRVKVLKEG